MLLACYPDEAVHSCVHLRLPPVVSLLRDKKHHHREQSGMQASSPQVAWLKAWQALRCGSDRPATRISSLPLGCPQEETQEMLPKQVGTLLMSQLHPHHSRCAVSLTRAPTAAGMTPYLPSAPPAGKTADGEASHRLACSTFSPACLQRLQHACATATSPATAYHLSQHCCQGTESSRLLTQPRGETPTYSDWHTAGFSLTGCL